ncbi:SprT family protein, partial [Bacillus thuringiensis]|nr:SprT family protein [Bacillus thuringiensis]
MNQEELQRLTEQISRDYFKRPFLHEVKINRRMTTT